MPKKEEVQEKVKKGLKVLREKAKEFTTAAADYLELQAQIGKLKFEVLALQRQIDSNLKAIGKEVLNESRNTEPRNPLDLHSVKKALKEIAQLEGEIELKRENIAHLTGKSSQTPPSKPQTPKSPSSRGKRKPGKGGGE